MKCLYDKKWIHPTDQVLTREVTFVDNTDDATAEICLADEDKDDCIITLEGDKKVYCTVYQSFNYKYIYVDFKTKNRLFRYWIA